MISVTHIENARDFSAKHQQKNYPIQSIKKFKEEV